MSGSLASSLLLLLLFRKNIEEKPTTALSSPSNCPRIFHFYREGFFLPLFVVATCDRAGVSAILPIHGSHTRTLTRTRSPEALPTRNPFPAARPEPPAVLCTHTPPARSSDSKGKERASEGGRAPPPCSAPLALRKILPVNPPPERHSQDSAGCILPIK